MNTDTPHAQHLELRVREIGQLFNSMDPTPFLNKDLDREAEAFIETWALGLPPDSQLHLTIHVEHLPAEGDPTVLMTDAIHNDFGSGSAKRCRRRRFVWCRANDLGKCVSARSTAASCSLP